MNINQESQSNVNANVTNLVFLDQIRQKLLKCLYNFFVKKADTSNFPLDLFVIFVLILQEQKKQIEELMTEISKLKATVSEQEERIAKLEAQANGEVNGNQRQALIQSRYTMFHLLQYSNGMQI